MQCGIFVGVDGRVEFVSRDPLVANASANKGGWGECVFGGGGGVG